MHLSSSFVGNLWLYGGFGFTDVWPNYGALNDLWKFNMASGEWTFVSGDYSVGNGVYGTRGVTSPSVLPGSRAASAMWVDASDQIYIFGGPGFDSVNGYIDGLNDVFKFDGTQWTWLNGSNTTASGAGKMPSLGLAKTFTSTNTPGGRTWGAASTQMGKSICYIYCGYGQLSYTDYDQAEMWAYDLASNQWACMGGCDSRLFSVYGTKGVFNSANNPGSRIGAGFAATPKNEIYLFGGSNRNFDPTAFGDFWKWK